jgi:hypothetical protein
MVLAVFITAPGLAEILNVVVLVIFGVFILESFLIARGVKKIIVKNYGSQEAKGVWLYVAFRALYPRFFRLPRPQVARGTKI